MAGSSKIDNIIIGTPLVDPQLLGVAKNEKTLYFSFEELRNDRGNVFLPAVLRQAGIFNSTNEVKQVNKQRGEKISKDSNQDLWRNLETPEFTQFKVGRKIFWILVGE